MGQRKKTLLKGPTARLATAFPDLLILSQFRKGDCLNGYQVMKRVQEATGVRLSTSTLYPMLAEFETRGLLTSTGSQDEKGARQRAREHHCYRITDAGIDYLMEVSTTLSGIVRSNGKATDQVGDLIQQEEGLLPASLTPKASL